MFATSWHELACARLVFQGFTVKVSRGNLDVAVKATFTFAKDAKDGFFIDKIG